MPATIIPRLLQRGICLALVVCHTLASVNYGQPAQLHHLNNPVIHHAGPNAFTITTPPATDIWRPNVTADNFTAPYVYRVCQASRFRSIAVTISAAWKTEYDQGGLAIVFPSRNEKKPTKGAKWVKSGIEYTEGAPQLGTVATYAFSDWSLSPVVPAGATGQRVRAERSTTEMWVYLIRQEGQRQALREVTWAFLEDRGKKDVEIWVGVYAAKPTYNRNPRESLEVTFKDLEIDC